MALYWSGGGRRFASQYALFPVWFVSQFVQGFSAGPGSVPSSSEYSRRTLKKSVSVAASWSRAAGGE